VVRMTSRLAKILAVTSAANLDFQYGCTPAWWQLWKGMYEAGVDLIVTPYRGPAVQSPWWRSADNPCLREGEAFAKARGLVARAKGDTQVRRAEHNPDDTTVDKATREMIWRWVTPRWKRHLEKILERERDIDAVIFFGVPMNHFRGIPNAIRAKFDVPVVYYDGDVPMSLPEFGGMDSGFNIYHGADASEYDLLISNSEGGIPRLIEMGARRAEPLFWGADPDFFFPMPVEKRCDVFFYGHGDKFRRDWMGTMAGTPSRRLLEVDFVLGGGDYHGDTGIARELPGIPFNAFAEAISAARINLNITRRSHATVPLSSTCRPFELAACGAAVVSNPHAGIEQWFTPGEEIMIVNDVDEAVAAYEQLLGDPAQAIAMGERARQRVLDEHTYSQRARQLLGYLNLDRVLV
jgi:spore maturation protein CgeB